MRIYGVGASSADSCRPACLLIYRHGDSICVICTGVSMQRKRSSCKLCTEPLARSFNTVFTVRCNLLPPAVPAPFPLLLPQLRNSACAPVRAGVLTCVPAGA
jgi:hypothetical protein